MKDNPETRERCRPDHHRGSRHLRVGITLQQRSVSIASIWVVDQPVIQADRLVGPILARIDLAAGPVLLQAFDDPRISRGTYRKELGHSYSVHESGLVQVSVPFDDPRELSELRIRLIDAARLGAVAVDPAAVARVFDAQPESAVELADFGIDALRKHRDFADVARHLGWDLDPGCFEIYVDRAGGYRWRLRRQNGEWVAESAVAYPSRESCEDAIRWMRMHAASSCVGSLDIPGIDCKPQK